MRLCNAEVYISHSILVHMHLIYTANLCSQEVKYRVLLHQIFDMQLLPPQQAQIMHWLLSLKNISLAAHYSVHKRLHVLGVNIIHHAALQASESC